METHEKMVPSTKELGVYAFYSILTWIISPLATSQVYKGERSKELGFVVGFVVSLVLYEKFGKSIIYKK